MVIFALYSVLVISVHEKKLKKKIHHSEEPPELGIPVRIRVYWMYGGMRGEKLYTIALL